MDSESLPLWVPSTHEGAPSMLNGYPYVVNGHMDSVAAGKVPILFGNFSYYGNRTGIAVTHCSKCTYKIDMSCEATVPSTWATAGTPERLGCAA